MAVPRHLLMATLRRALERCERQGIVRPERVISSGAAVLDSWLPWGGLRPGSLVEYLSASEASGAAALALLAGKSACQEGQAFVIFDRQQQFYPPAASHYGMALTQVLVVRPPSLEEERWAVDQALRSPAVGAVWLRCGRLDAHDFRRFQLAAESGGAVGLLLRPTKVRGEPTWSDVQWLVRPEPGERGRRIRVELARCRGAAPGRSAILEWNQDSSSWREPEHAQNPLPALARVAHPAFARRQTGA